MLRMIALIATAFALVACAAPPADENGQRVFRIGAADTNKIHQRHVEAVNAVRQAQGLQPVQFSSQLASAAKAHARDIAQQARPWHFGSDGSDPIVRVQRSGYAGRVVAENISETFENDTQTLEAWLSDPVTRRGILNPNARNIGLSWEQEPSGKIWWVQVLGS